MATRSFGGFRVASGAFWRLEGRNKEFLVKCGGSIKSFRVPQYFYIMETVVKGSTDKGQKGFQEDFGGSSRGNAQQRVFRRLWMLERIFSEF